MIFFLVKTLPTETCLTSQEVVHSAFKNRLKLSSNKQQGVFLMPTTNIASMVSVVCSSSAFNRRHVLNLHRTHYENQVIARIFSIRFGERFAQFSNRRESWPLDLFLCSYLKNKIYRDRPHIIKKMKIAIPCVRLSVLIGQLKTDY